MTTTIHNIEHSRGELKVILFIEGQDQIAKLYLEDRLVLEMKYKKDQDMQIDLLDIIENDFEVSKQD